MTPSDPGGVPPPNERPSAPAPVAAASHDPLTTPAPADDIERRLHPFSWLFAALTQLRAFILPLVVLVFLGRGMAGWELWGLLGAFFVALYSLVYSFSFRYRLAADELIVKEGFLFRTERHVPYARIQNVVQQRNVLHRAFGVTALHLESAGGSKPEAVMNVITVAEAARIEAVLARGGTVSAATVGEGEAPLVALGVRDLFHLGLMTNRGAVVVGAFFALFYQFEPWEWRSMRPMVRELSHVYSWMHDAFAGPLAFSAALLLAAFAFVVVMKVLSVVMAFVTFYAFRLRADDTRVVTESGLFTRRTASARLDKIQRYSIAESWIARRLGRRALECAVAAGGGNTEDGEKPRERLRWLAPVAPPAQVDALLQRFAPDLAPSRTQWRPLHPKAWRRMFKHHVAIWSLLAVPAAVWLQGLALPLWVVAVVYGWFATRGAARFSGWSHDGTMVAWRTGWLSRRWTFARVAKGQTVAWLQSPFDRRAGMAGVRLDTAGAGLSGFPLHVTYLAEADARVLFDALRRAVAAASLHDESVATTTDSPLPVATSA